MRGRVRIFLTYALLGPPLGGWMAVVWLFSDRRWVADVPWRELTKALAGLVVYGALGGYALGFLPAALAGLVLALINPSPKLANLPLALVTSLATCVVQFGVVTAIRSGMGPAGIGSLQTYLAVIGLIAGAACWLVVVLLARRRERAHHPAA